MREVKLIALLTAYTMRAVLNISITEMVYREGHNSSKKEDNTCPDPAGSYVAEREGYDWSEQLQGIILGAFFWGYVRKLVICDSVRYTILAT